MRTLKKLLFLASQHLLFFFRQIIIFFTLLLYYWRVIPSIWSTWHLFLCFINSFYRGKHNKLREEFEYLSMVKLAESEKLRQSEQRLYEIELQSEKFRNDNMKLKLKLEETKNKLQGGMDGLQLFCHIARILYIAYLIVYVRTYLKT